MVGVRNINSNEYFVTFLPKNVSNLRMEIIGKKLYICWVTEESQIELKKVLGNVEDETLLNIKENYEIWDIINSFNTYVCGDLAFYATIIGRDNTSHCSCPYCDLPRSEWSKKWKQRPTFNIKTP